MEEDYDQKPIQISFSVKINENNYQSNNNITTISIVSNSEQKTPERKLSKRPFEEWKRISENSSNSENSSPKIKRVKFSDQEKESENGDNIDSKNELKEEEEKEKEGESDEEFDSSENENEQFNFTNPKSLISSSSDSLIDHWDDNHVRMPFSLKNITNGKNGNQVISKWILIQESLNKKFKSIKELQGAILSYNTRYIGRWNFDGLETFIEKEITPKEKEYFFETLLPKIIKLALNLPSLCKNPIPLLYSGLEHHIMLSQHQIASLLANAFLCTFPRRGTFRAEGQFKNYPTINFNELYYGPLTPKMLGKLKTLINYFLRVTNKMPTGNVSFYRRVFDETDFPSWTTCLAKFGPLNVFDEGTIEDNGKGMLQVDFANRFIGGGVLSKGCVQEEIRFLINPELIVSRLFTEAFRNNECLFIIGSERFSSYSGFADTFKFSGNFEDTEERDNLMRKKTIIVAIDALPFNSSNSLIQYSPDSLERELNKLYLGFSLSNALCDTKFIASGNWGSGAFSGDKELKGCLQLMASAVSKKELNYFTFGDQEFGKSLKNLHSKLLQNQMVIKDLWRILVDYGNCKDAIQMGIFDYIKTVFDS